MNNVDVIAVTALICQYCNLIIIILIINHWRNIDILVLDIESSVYWGKARCHQCTNLQDEKYNNLISSVRDQPHQILKADDVDVRMIDLKKVLLIFFFAVVVMFCSSTLKNKVFLLLVGISARGW